MNIPRMALGSWAFSFGPFENDPWSFPRVLQFTADAGFDGIEINGFRPHPHPDDYDTAEKCTNLVNEIDDFGLGISGYAPAFGEVPPSIVPERIYLESIEKALKFCNRCGITTLRVDSVRAPEELEDATYHEEFSQLARTWKSAAELCSRSGVLLVWEFEPGFWLNKPSEVLSMYDAVGHENFKLLFDTSHAYMGAVVGARHTGKSETLTGGVREYAEMLGDAIGHLHLIDSDGTLHDDETSTHSPFGEGVVDFHDALSPISGLISRFPWWTADFCFCAETDVAAPAAPQIMRAIAEEFNS